MENRVGFRVKVEIDGGKVIFRSEFGCLMHAHSDIGCVCVYKYIYVDMCMCVYDVPFCVWRV